jgi:predicted double-glycine peptidase
MVGIPLWLNIMLIIGCIFLGSVECTRLFKKDANLEMKTVLKRAPYLYVLIPLSLILLVVANLNRPRLIWNLPLWLQYHYTALTWGGILAIFTFIFSLASAVAIRTRHRERWKIVIAGILLIFVIQVIQWNYTRPIAPRLKNIVATSGTVMQTSNASCAAASGASIVRSFDMQKTEKQMAELFGTTVGGTSGAQVIYGMREIGFSCNKVEVSDSNPENLSAPAMVFIDNQFTGPESHAVAYMGFNKDKAEIFDPLEGRRFLSKNQLAKIWHGRGIEFGLKRGGE